jgi:hypothetical protein
MQINSAAPLGRTRTNFAVKSVVDAEVAQYMGNARAPKTARASLSSGFRRVDQHIVAQLQRGLIEGPLAAAAARRKHRHFRIINKDVARFVGPGRLLT